MEVFKANKTFTAQDARRGSIEKFEDLPPIEWYENTLWTFENRREIEREVYKKEDLEAFDHYMNNVTELSREMHDFYIVDPDDGTYQFPNTSYVIIMGPKDDTNTLYLGSILSHSIEELNALNIIPLFLDTRLDDIVAATYDRKFIPQVFMIDNETQKAYSWEFQDDGAAIDQWVLNKSYLASNISFSVPRVLPW